MVIQCKFQIPARAGEPRNHSKIGDTYTIHNSIEYTAFMAKSNQPWSSVCAEHVWWWSCAWETDWLHWNQSVEQRNTTKLSTQTHVCSLKQSGLPTCTDLKHVSAVSSSWCEGQWKYNNRTRIGERDKGSSLFSFARFTPFDVAMRMQSALECGRFLADAKCDLLSSALTNARNT